MDALAIRVSQVRVEGPGVKNGIYYAHLTDTPVTSIVFNLRQQYPSDPSSRFRPNDIEPHCPSVSVWSEDGESQYLSLFIYSNIVAATLLKIAIEMGPAVIRVHNVLHVLEDCVFYRIINCPLTRCSLHYRVVHYF
jgi:hypothetical protein